MGKILTLVNLEKTLNLIPVYSYEAGIVVVLNCFEWNILVYASVVRIIMESGFYNIGVKIMATMFINLLNFIYCNRK